MTQNIAREPMASGSLARATSVVSAVVANEFLQPRRVIARHCGIHLMLGVVAQVE
jgi:hypothetical protein